jgi:hypothetical protein
MTPIEKATELFQQYRQLLDAYNFDASLIHTASVRCCIIVVNQTLKLKLKTHEINFWRNVKKELLKL